MAERVVQVPAARIPAWVENFGARHGAVKQVADEVSVTLTAADGAVARLLVPWLPWQGDDVDGLVAHLGVRRRFGVVLARKSAHAVGIVDGDAVVASANDRHYVQGRTKAGGWSQQRYARRRENQAKAAFKDAADDVAAVLLPELESLDWLVTGGEQTAVDAVLADPRLRPMDELRARSPQRAWPTPDPRKAVLEDFVATFQAVPVELNELA